MKFTACSVRALRAIRDCRTAALGGHLHECDRCGHRVILYNSCRNRHCPKCQATARARWLEQREAELLPFPYFHIVFTLPKQIGYLALQNARTIYNILFRAAAQTLLETAADPSLLGASIGFSASDDSSASNRHASRSDGRHSPLPLPHHLPPRACCAVEVFLLEDGQTEQAGLAASPVPLDYSILQRTLTSLLESLIS